MKLNELILRRPLFVAFGTSQQTGGLTSVDLEATRDDSQVVISASDGSVAPVAGADATTAGVMTAADKAALEALPPTTTREFAARADIAAATVSAAITHLRSAGHSVAGDGGGAVYTRAGAEPAHALKVQSADGAWWELVPDIAGISVRQAGAVGDDVTDDSQAFLDALAGAGEFNSNGTSVAVNRVVVPPGAYYLGATTLELKKMVNLTGLGSGQAGRQPAILRWDVNTTGIIVHRGNTIGAGVEASPSGGADGSIIEGLWLKSDGGTIANVTDDTKGHGIWLRTRAVLRELIIEDFPGNGINIVATAGSSDDAREGNANEWFAEILRITGCHQNGIYADGADVNQGLAIKPDVTGNGRWGIRDSSFLGNAYYSAHSAANGIAERGENPTGSSSFVTFSGRHYAANVNATEADLVATQPGTDASVWIDVRSGSASTGIPLWQSGQPEGTYFHGGSYHTDSANAHNAFYSAYGESNQALPQLVTPTLYFSAEGFEASGTHGGFGADATGVTLYGEVGVKNQQRHTPDRDIELRFNDRDNVPLSLHADGDSGAGWAFKWVEGSGHWGLQHTDLNSRRPLRLTTNLNSVSLGRASNLPGGQLLFFNGFWVGNNLNARFFFQDDVVPSAGEHAQGDTVLNSAPTVQTDTDGVDWIIYGWKCTAGGSPGTWQTLWTRVSTPPGL